MSVKGHIWKMLDVPGKEKREKDPFGSLWACEFRQSSNPVCHHHLPGLFQLLPAYSMMSQGHVLNVESLRRGLLPSGSTCCGGCGGLPAGSSQSPATGASGLLRWPQTEAEQAFAFLQLQQALNRALMTSVRIPSPT